MFTGREPEASDDEGVVSWILARAIGELGRDSGTGESRSDISIRHETGNELKTGDPGRLDSIDLKAGKDEMVKDSPGPNPDSDRLDELGLDMSSTRSALTDRPK